MNKRVAVTGLGIIAPNGTGKEAYWQALVAGQSAVGMITRFDASRYYTQLGAEVRDFLPHPRIPFEHVIHMDRAFQMGVSAALMATEDAGLDSRNTDADRWGVYMGIAAAGVDRYEPDFRILREQGIENVHKNWYQGWFSSASSGYISLILGLRGSSHVLSTGCSSSVDAIGLAMDNIRNGREDVALAGGTESPITPLCLNAFCAMRALSTRVKEPTKASRPFDKERDGFVLAEGAAVLLLESWDHATARGATIYAELKGYGTTSNAYHMTAPEPSAEQTARCFRIALEDADLPGQEIGAFFAHGSSTPLNETVETLAVKKAFNGHSQDIAISGIKSMIGHTLGSAGSLQVAAGVLSLVHGVVPPTINQEVPDPTCDLDYVPNVARKKAIRAVMTNTSGFSGKNSATVLCAF